MTNAAIGAHEPIIEFLLSRGADVNFINSSGRTPFHVCAKLGCLGGMRLLLRSSQRFDVNQINKEGWTALHWAVEFEKWISVDFLLASGATMMKNKTNQSPYHLAMVSKKRQSIVDYLEQVQNIHDIFLNCFPLDIVLVLNMFLGFDVKVQKPVLM